MAALNRDRRELLRGTGLGLGALALGALEGRAAPRSGGGVGSGAARTHFPPRARRVIYLFQSGAPSQVEFFDHKPLLAERAGEDLPASVRMGQRLTGMTAGQKTLPLRPSAFAFRRRGESGAWVSDAMPHLARVADRLCFVKTMHTEAINHDPAITFFQTGHQQPGRPSMGAWISYGLGAESEELPAFCVLLPRNEMTTAQPLYARLWGAGFLPASHQGVKLRAAKDPVLYLSDPSAPPRAMNRELFEAVGALDRLRAEATGSDALDARVASYELAARMQTSVPELADLSAEPESTFALYGEEARDPKTYAGACLTARRLVERGVRFVQVYQRGWDSHSRLAPEHRRQCAMTDRGSAALVEDLARRGLLEDTLVVWGGEFGRTVYAQGSQEPERYGRDHHPRCFTVWMAGGGVRAGCSYGETDEFGYNVVRDGVHVHDLQATVLHLLGLDHERLTFPFQGRDYRLTDVHGEVVGGVLA